MLLLSASAMALSGCGGDSKDSDSPAQTLEITSPTRQTALENSTWVTQLSATGASAVTYSLSGGPDIGQFSLDSNSGDLSFSTPPDYEAPSDTGADNIYEVEITASGPGGLTDSQVFTIEVTDSSTPGLTIHFPPAGANLGGTNVVRVTGDIEDLEDRTLLDVDLPLFVVDGISATQDAANNKQWSADITPEQGPGTFGIQVTSQSGETINVVHDYVNEVPFPAIGRIHLNPASNEIIVRSGNGGLFGISRSDGSLRLISGFSQGLESSLGLRWAFDIDTRNNLAVFPVNGTGVVKVDLDTGEYSVASTGKASIFGMAQDAAVDEARNVVYLADPNGLSVHALDLDTAQETYVTRNHANSGPYITSARSLALDADNDRLFVGDKTKILAVDLATGNRSTVSDSSTGSGPALNNATQLDYDSRSGFLYVADDTRIIQVDTSSGNRVLLTSSGAIGDVVLDNDVLLFSNKSENRIESVSLSPGEPVPLYSGNTHRSDQVHNTFGGHLDLANNLIYVLDAYAMSINAISLEDFSTEKTYDISVSSGTPLTWAYNFTFDQALQNALVLAISDSFMELHKIDYSTGALTLVSSNSQGSGPSLDGSSEIVLHPNNQSAFALNWADRSIISIDLASGDRTILSGDATGTGPSFDLPAGIALNAAGNQLLVVDRDLSALVEVNVATGDRTIISDPSTGIGPELSDLSDVIYGLNESHAYVFDKVLGIFEIDLSTGDRTQISGTTEGNGFFPANPNQYTKLLLDKSKRLLYMLDSSKGFLVAVELSSGDRALLPVK